MLSIFKKPFSAEKAQKPDRFLRSKTETINSEIGDFSEKHRKPCEDDMRQVSMPSEK